MHINSFFSLNVLVQLAHLFLSLAEPYLLIFLIFKSPRSLRTITAPALPRGKAFHLNHVQLLHRLLPFPRFLSQRAEKSSLLCFFQFFHLSLYLAYMHGYYRISLGIVISSQSFSLSLHSLLLLLLFDMICSV